MKENKYDDAAFFGMYSEMGRSKEGLEAAGEWHTFRSLLPSLEGKKVLDLGCGYGWHCRYAREQKASAVTGVDISRKMLDRARELTNDPAIRYQQDAIEDIHFKAGEFDVVISSLAFHYVADFNTTCQKVQHCLKPGGAFVFSVEHPIFTAIAAQDWHYDKTGKRLHWPVDDYQRQGFRNTRFLGHDVVKYHRTLAAYINTLIDNGFRIAQIAEPEPSAEALKKFLEMKDENRRPMFLLVRAERV